MIMFSLCRFLKEVGREISEDLVVLMPNLLSLLKHDDPAVVRQSIASGTILFGAVLEEMALQVLFCKNGCYIKWMNTIPHSCKDNFVVLLWFLDEFLFFIVSVAICLPKQLTRVMN